MSESNNWPFDCKQISADNWKQIDAAPKIWCEMTAVAKNEEQWIEFFFLPKLDSKVPPEIAKLLEVARGAMIYGWNFYPLLTLGIEQCYRLLDTGTRIRCNQLGISTVVVKKNGDKGNTPFKQNIDALIKLGIVSKNDEVRWNAVRSLRNWSSHPERQSLYDPGQAQGTLSLVVEFLNDLFR
jgi:hypothetical protein